MDNVDDIEQVDDDDAILHGNIQYYIHIAYLVLYHLHTSPMYLFQSKSQDRQVCFIVQKYYLRQPFFSVLDDIAMLATTIYM